VVVTRRHLSLLILALAAVLFMAPFATPPISGQATRPGVVALRGGTIVTVTKGTIRNGTVLMRDGKIAAVGTNVDIPAGAEVIDVTGKFVSPGIIDAHSHIAADAINEGGTTVSSMTGIEDVLDPTDISIYRDLAGGLTVANVLHGSANPIGGKNAVIKLRARRARRSLVRGGDAGHQVRPWREPQGHHARSAQHARAIPDHARRRRVRHPGRVHARQGLQKGLAGL
jgi:imidazolonepropionase-like amidohydrolase